MDNQFFYGPFKAPVGTLEQIVPAPMRIRSLWDLIPWSFILDILGPVTGIR